MAILQKRFMTLAWCLALCALIPGQAQGAAKRGSWAQGWSMALMPARQKLPYPSLPSYGPTDGEPGSLLASRHGLVALGFSFKEPPLEWVSENARNWQQIVVPAQVFGRDTVKAAAAARPGLVLVGSRWKGSSIGPEAQPDAWFSADGRTWRRATAIGNAFALGEMNAVTAFGSGFVAIGDIYFPGDEFHPEGTRTAVWMSPGGGRWQLVTDDSPTFQSAAGLLIAQGGEGLIALGMPRNPPGPEESTPGVIVWTSRDGRAWQRVAQGLGVFPTGYDLHLEGLVAGKGRYVAWGSSFSNMGHSFVWDSADGIHWRQTPGIHFQYGVVANIVSHGNGFIALGERDHEPALWSSADGEHWAPVAGEDVFGGADTRVAGALDWKGGMVVVGAYNQAIPFNTVSFAGYAGAEYHPAAWLWRAGTRGQQHPNWPKTDPKWFRLRIEDLPSGFNDFGGQYPFGGGAYGSHCITSSDPAAQKAGAACLKAAAALGTSLAYAYWFPRGGANPSNGETEPYVAGFSILAQSAADAQAAFQYADGLVVGVDGNNRVQPKLVRDLAIGNGAKLFSYAIASCATGFSQCPTALLGGTSYAVVWRDGRALGVVAVVGVSGDREGLAVRLAQREWARWHALGI